VVGADEEEEGGSYTVVSEAADPDSEEKKKEINYGSLRDKFPKSKRGPAIAKVVKPSSYILFAAALSALCAVVYLCWGLWPFIFSDSPRGQRRLASLCTHIRRDQFRVQQLICHARQCIA
jgi:hypothetical protein